MTDDKLAPNPDVKWGKPNRVSPDGADKAKSDYFELALANANKTLELVKAKFRGGVLDERISCGEVRVEVESALMPYVLEFLRDHPDLEYVYLSQVAGAEWHKHLQTGARHFYVTYDVQSFNLRTRFFVYAVLPRVNPAVPSSAHLFPTADWHEREIFDLFGIVFEGHPNLKRILLPPNYDGHPLLKEYPARGKDVWELGKNVMPLGYDEILGEYEKGGLGRLAMSNSVRTTVDAGAGAVDSKEKLIRINMGPQHPSTHGVLRLILELEGEKVVSCTPDIGFLHTGIEKISETRNWTKNIHHYPRLDYLSPMNNELCYCLAVEKLIGLHVPRRAQYIRVLMSEMTRIISHLVWLGTHAIDIGAMSVFLYCFIEREKILKFYEEIGGQRMMTAYMRIGGVAADMPEGFEAAVDKFLNEFPARIKLYEGLLTKNPIWIRRTKGVGAMSAERAIAWGLSGPILRASGVDWDIRRDNPYLVYPELNFDVPLGENGDVYDRYLVRIEEMRQSVRLSKQCMRVLKKMGRGEGELDHTSRDPKFTPPKRAGVQDSIEQLIHHFKYWTEGIHPPVGEAYANIEAPKGELGFWVISDGSELPWRVKIRPPSFVNLSALGEMVKGHLLADVVATLGSIDIVLGEIDR